jgi:hypothetical protein
LGRVPPDILTQKTALAHQAVAMRLTTTAAREILSQSTAPEKD